jgi:hypothetical protein
MDRQDAVSSLLGAAGRLTLAEIYNRHPTITLYARGEDSDPGPAIRPGQLCVQLPPIGPTIGAVKPFRSIRLIAMTS